MKHFKSFLFAIVLSALLVFRLLPRGFCNRELREHLAPLLGEDPSALSQGQMTYQLRRLRSARRVASAALLRSALLCRRLRQLRSAGCLAILLGGGRLPVGAASLPGRRTRPRRHSTA